MITVAALFVDERPGGAYVGLEGVDVWGLSRDARNYAGPHPVVCHSPCQRWGRYWHGGPSAKVRMVKGDDGGCFASALASVRRFGGVLEHPEASAAWATFGLAAPPKSGGWIMADFAGGWTCCVEQGHYGHRARKATWLYAHGVELPSLRWGPSARKLRIDGHGFHTVAESEAWYAKETGKEYCCAERLNKTERAATPLAFRDVLLEMARSVEQRRAA